MFLPIAYFNERYLPFEEISLPVTDLSIQRGYAVFDFFKLIDLHNPWLDWYMERLQNSLRLAQLVIPYSPEELKTISTQLLDSNNRQSGYVKIIVTAGSSNDGYSKSDQPRVIFLATDIKARDPQLYKNGGNLLSREFQREIAGIKSTAYLHSAVMAKTLSSNGAADVLYHQNGWITECSRSNFFKVKDGKITTPDQNILEGITRKRVLAELKGSNLLRINNIAYQNVLESDEIFITSTTKGVLPITKIDNNLVGNGRVGPLTKKLMSVINEF